MLAYRLVPRLALALVLAAVSSWGVRADDKTASGTPQAAEAEKRDADVKGDPTKGRYELPDDITGLLAFVEGIHGYRSANPAEVNKNRGKSSGAVEAALEKIHDIATDEDRKLPGFDDAMGLRLVFRTIIFGKGPRAGSPAQKAQLLEEIKSTLESSPRPSKDAVSAAMKAAIALEYGDKPERELAVDVYRGFGGILAKSTDPQTAATGAKMQGAARRLELVGKPLELSGTLMGGAKFDWAAYRGKVVLLEFWATWCGPCIRELPNVKQNFEDYHDRGFDVVGISLDDDREALEHFLDQQPQPWPTLYDGGLDKNPVARYYGLMGPSTAILVDKDGRVVSMNARGAELGKYLATLLGPNEADGTTKESTHAPGK